MKPAKSCSAAETAMSPPARGRGLKRSSARGWRTVIIVAPRAGAWIETLRVRELLRGRVVAPRAGAWIETGRQAAPP